MKVAVIAVVLWSLQAGDQSKTVLPTAKPKEQMQITFFGEDLKSIKIKQWVAIIKFAGDFYQTVELPKGEVEAKENQIPLVCQGLTPVVIRVEGKVHLVRWCPTIHILEVEAENNSIGFLVNGNYVLVHPTTALKQSRVILDYYNWLTDQSKTGELQVVVANNPLKSENDLEKITQEVLNKSFNRIPRSKGAKRPIRHDQLAILSPPKHEKGWCTVEIGHEQSKILERIWEVREDKPFMIRFNLPLKEIPKDALETPAPQEPDATAIIPPGKIL